MVGVDIDDHHVVEIALVRLFARVRQQARGIELLDRYAATAISDDVHDIFSVSSVLVSFFPCHCERSEAIQLHLSEFASNLDCFVALLLAMTLT